MTPFQTFATIMCDKKKIKKNNYVISQIEDLSTPIHFFQTTPGSFSHKVKALT